MDDYDELFPALYARAYRVAFRILGEREEARDVAQEALARAYAHWPRVRDRASGWVCTVAANLAIDATRRARRRPPYAEEAREDRHREERLDLQRALAGLLRRQRQVVVLRYLADLPEEAVAATLGCSVGSVKTHGSRGLAKLRSVLTTFPAGG